MNDGPFEEDLDPPPFLTVEEMHERLERGIADVQAGRTIEGHVALARLRLFIDTLKEKQRQADGAPVR